MNKDVLLLFCRCCAHEVECEATRKYVFVPRSDLDFVSAVTAQDDDSRQFSKLVE